MSTSKEYRAVRNFILNELHLTNPFNEETEVFIRKRYNMSIGVDPEEN